MNNKKTKIKWKKPVVETYGDAVDVIKGLCDDKELESGDGCFQCELQLLCFPYFYQ